MKLNVIDLGAKDMMVSFNVVSLFTRVQVQVREALRVIEDLLKADDTSKTRATMLPADIVSLTRLCLTTTYFQFWSALYEQEEGATMGSPLSLVGAKIYMQDLECRTMTTAPSKPLL